MGPLGLPRLACVLLALSFALSSLSSYTAALSDWSSTFDATSPSFDVDAGWTAEARLQRLQTFAAVPPKGWNSYDGWDWSVTEADVVANVDFMAANLTRFGYQLAVVDFYWYLDLDEVTVFCDDYGRVQPDPTRFPSSVGEQGFKKLAAYAHSKSLLFGIHIMRGISQAAVTQRLPVLGTNWTADEVYDANNSCFWQPTGRPEQVFYSLNMSHPGGQAFYDSLFRQYAEWGVDFIKNDVRTPHTAVRTRPPPLQPSHPLSPAPWSVCVRAVRARPDRRRECRH